MERIKKIFLGFFILFFWMNIYPQDSQNIDEGLKENERKIYTPEEILNGIKNRFYNLIPPTFSAYIESETIRESLKRLPEKAIIDRKKMRVKIFFHKKWGVRVILEGVIEPFKNRFAYMEKVFEFIKLFNCENKAFFKTYEIFDIREDSFKLRKKGALGTYLKLFFDVAFNIKKVQEYKDNKHLTTIFIRYRMINKSILIDKVRVLFYEENNLKILEFWLKDFDININIDEDIFLGYYYGYSKDKSFIC